MMRFDMELVNSKNNMLYTVGYTSYSRGELLAILIKYKITAVVDVRSSPFSSYYAEFNQDVLKAYLNANYIFYVPMGKELGARQSDNSVYREGKADYGKIANLGTFKDGINRLITGLTKYNIVLLCAEKDPMTCHRTILICRHMKKYCNILHIWPHKYYNEEVELETHECLESRLLKKFNKDHIDILKSSDQLLAEAYDMQGNEIAYHVNSEALGRIEVE